MSREVDKARGMFFFQPLEHLEQACGVATMVEEFFFFLNILKILIKI